MAAIFACGLLLSGLAAFSGDFWFTPSDPDLMDLPHASYFTWGIQWSLPAGEEITAAQLTYFKIYDWVENEQDHLYTHLLDTVTDTNGTRSPNWAWDPTHTYKRITIQGTDNEGGGDKFALKGPLLGDWNDPDGPKTKIDLSYDVSKLNFNIISDGNFGIGIDPDCHYYNCGIKFHITTKRKQELIPEPMSFILGSIGLAAVRGFRRLRVK